MVPNGIVFKTWVPMAIHDAPTTKRRVSGSLGLGSRARAYIVHEEFVILRESLHRLPVLSDR